VTDLQQHAEIHSLHERIHRVRDMFPGQRSTEKILLIVQRHWIVELGIFLRFIALATSVPVLVLLAFSFVNVDITTWRWIYFILMIYLIFSWLYTFVEFLKNDLSVLIITNERVVDNVQVSLFEHRVSEGNLDRIQDVIGNTHGFLSTFLDVGTLEIQTAGLEPFRLRMIKSPQLTARKVLNIQQQSSQRRRNADYTSRPETTKTVQVTKESSVMKKSCDCDRKKTRVQ